MSVDAALGSDQDFSTLVILLLKSAIHRAADERLWTLLIEQQCRVRDYVGVLGLELALDDAEGYALLKPRTAHDAGAVHALPELIPQNALSLSAGLLLALLRKRLAEFDACGGASRLVLRQDDMVALLRPFLAAASSDAHLIEQVQAQVDRVVELGFLRRMASQSGPVRYEVRRILRAFVDAPWLVEFDLRLSPSAALAVAAAVGPGAAGSQ